MRITTWAEYGVICALHLARRSDAQIEGITIVIPGGRYISEDSEQVK